MVQRPMTPLGTARLGAAPNFILVTLINSMLPPPRSTAGLALLNLFDVK
jgi:hypothetical protein